MANTTHAVGQMQGYLRQVQHMFYELISIENVTVSVEAIDDVAVQRDDNIVIAEQLKSVTSDGNPVANKSSVFWKTLYNWLQYIKNNTLSIDSTVFRFIVISADDVKSGDIINAFNNSNNNNDAQSALTNARTVMWGENNKIKSNVPKSYNKYLIKIFDNANRAIVEKIIAKMTIVVYKDNYDEELKARFKGIPGLQEEYLDELYTYMYGWVSNNVVKICKTGSPAYISKDDFSAELAAQQRMYNQNNSIPTLSSSIDTDEAKSEVKQQDTYIRQLELIESNYDEKINAASDYLRTKAEVTARAEKGYFTPQSLDDYNDRLKRSWKSVRTEYGSTLISDAERGKQVFEKMCYLAINIRLQGADVPSFFGSGSLHALANAPMHQPEIGWHPDYENLLIGGSANE